MPPTMPGTPAPKHISSAGPTDMDQYRDSCDAAPVIYVFVRTGQKPWMLFEAISQIELNPATAHPPLEGPIT